MKTKLFFIVVFLVLIIFTIPALVQESKKGKSDFPVLKGKYLNIEINEGGPLSMCFSPNGKYLIFLLRRSTETRERGIYWISIEALKINWVTSEEEVKYD